MQLFLLQLHELSDLIVVVAVQKFQVMFLLFGIIFCWRFRVTSLGNRRRESPSKPTDLFCLDPFLISDLRNRLYVANNLRHL